MTNEIDALIDVAEVSRMAGISRTEVWRKVKLKAFPQPVRMGSRCTRYSRNEVLDWVRQRLAERVAA